MIVQAMRSLVFYAIYLTQTVIIAVIVGTVALFIPRRTAFTWALVRYWCFSNAFLVRAVAGIGTAVTGAENIPAGGCIIAAKHQSDWDVFAIFPYTERPAYIVKKELMRIPFFGWAARSLDCIEVDRKRGGDAIPAMMAQARDAVHRGCRIVIFPEGTRTMPLAAPAYKFGVARMYAELNVPVVPVALNSGLFWGRNSLILWPGRARARFLPAIMPGLSAEAMHQRLEADIETASNDLILRAAHEGLSRPVPPELRDKLEALERSASGSEAG